MEHDPKTETQRKMQGKSRIEYGGTYEAGKLQMLFVVFSQLITHNKFKPKMTSLNPPDLPVWFGS